MQGAVLCNEGRGDDLVGFGALVDGGENPPVVGREVAEVGGVQLHCGGCCVWVGSWA